MTEDERIYFVTGDLGYTVLEQIEKEFPKRFINAGVAEQNMIGIASGLALSGKKVYVYSIIPFLTMRCYEQIRDDVCYHNLDITLLGAGSGLSYGILGSTHFALEDLAIMRPLPNLTIFSPSDEAVARSGVRELRKRTSPVYIRVGKKQEPTIYEQPLQVSIGKPITIHPGKSLVIFATGTIMDEVLKTSELLKNKKNISATVVEVHTISPLDKASIVDIAKKHSQIVTVEEHGLIGGLGSAILETLNDNRIEKSILRIGTPNEIIHDIGTQEYLRTKVGLDAETIYSKIVERISS